MGGEEEALKRLQRFALDVPSQAASKTKASGSNSEAGGDSLYGANFSCKISPWLAMGCLSPRRMFEDLKKNSARFISIHRSLCSFNKGCLIASLPSMCQGHVCPCLINTTIP